MGLVYVLHGNWETGESISKSIESNKTISNIRKMARMGIRGVALKWFQAYLKKQGTRSRSYIQMQRNK
jgi:hypothetical protein